MEPKDHEQWMRYAIALAKKAWGDTHPNPMVGAVLVHNGKTVAEGFHARAGELHAERAVLQSIELSKNEQEECVLYVTLEPCCTHGRTPPCVEIILEKKIAHVVVGAIDPNPKHQGKGIEILETAGVKVTKGILEKECEDLNLIFTHRMKTGLPLIALKSATTLDGKIATSSGKSKWITGSKARQNVMRWRKYFPAIGIGAGTALADNPSLTVRENEDTLQCPIRFVFDRKLITQNHISELNLFQDQWTQQTILVTDKANPKDEIRRYWDTGCEVLTLDFARGAFPAEEFKKALDKLELFGVYLEGGAGLAETFLKADSIDYLFLYQAPKIFADTRAPSFVSGLTPKNPSEAIHLQNPIYEQFGDDFLTRGWVVKGLLDDISEDLYVERLQ